MQIKKYADIRNEKMKTYKDLNTLTEIAQAMDAGKIVERLYFTKPNSIWFELKSDSIASLHDFKHRTVEETELPEQGNEIMVWDYNETAAVPREFLMFRRGKVVAGTLNDSEVAVWNNWKHIDKKPVPREGWAYPSGIYDIRDTNMIHVREVLK